MRTFSNNKNIYSVDMMIAYINIYKPTIKKIKKILEKQLNEKRMKITIPNLKV